MVIKIAEPQEWLPIQVPDVIYSGTVLIPEHTIYVAPHYPKDETGLLIAGMRHAASAQFLRDHNIEHGTDFGWPTLAEDEAIRHQLGKNHYAFNENFARDGAPWRAGYIADVNRPYGKMQEGISGQMLVTRLVVYRLACGDEVIGSTTIAPSGMVPELERNRLEKLIHAEGLKILEQLRGREIFEKGDEVVDVRNALDYPQLTLDHDTRDEDGSIIPHSHHIYTPSQNEPERVGIRYAHWDHHDELRCFDVYLLAYPDYSYSDRSVPLVRGGVFGAKRTFKF